MKNTKTYNVFFATIIALSCYSLSAQNSESFSSKNSELSEVDKRQENFDVLKNLGYKEREIYEDLGNANFLSENYETAIFWYTQLFKLSEGTSVSNSYYERYHYALQLTNKTSVKNISHAKDWVAQVKDDYQIQKNDKANRYRDLDFTSNAETKRIEEFVNREIRLEQQANAKTDDELAVEIVENSPISITGDGNIAYFTKPVYVKPLYGVFSKKELVHKVYKAEKVKGHWKNVEEVALCPKNYSSMHPTVSEDGKRLFFASDMPGTYGKFDIYVADIQKDGTFGVAKNLGKKVNTNENDLYPNIVGGTSLFFASNGHQGYGGLDVYMVEVANSKVGWTVNLGSPINSNQDEFSIDLMQEKGTGYVLINRGKNKGKVERVAYAYSNTNRRSVPDRKEYNVLEALNTESQINYSTSIFEDK
tara:strand:- start:21731 stop:22990 length:1260 start_codon:yes stop_codon:yes gene_type:complete